MAADVWSFGIFLEELALGRAPYAHMKLESVILTTLHEDAPTLGTQKTKRKFSEVRTLLLSTFGKASDCSSGAYLYTCIRPNWTVCQGLKGCVSLAGNIHRCYSWLIWTPHDRECMGLTGAVGLCRSCRTSWRSACRRIPPSAPPALS